MKRSIISFSVLILLALASCSKKEMPVPQATSETVIQPNNSANKTTAQVPPPPLPPPPPPPRPRDPRAPGTTNPVQPGITQ